jgi:hypothetical protein
MPLTEPASGEKYYFFLCLLLSICHELDDIVTRYDIAKTIRMTRMYP